MAKVGFEVLILTIFQFGKSFKSCLHGSRLVNLRVKKVLDFGSGNGITASHYGAENQVTAIEPDEETVKNRCTENIYEQICGSLDELKTFEDETFDVILCHNVLEYAS